MGEIVKGNETESTMEETIARVEKRQDNPATMMLENSPKETSSTTDGDTSPLPSIEEARMQYLEEVSKELNSLDQDEQFDCSEIDPNHSERMMAFGRLVAANLQELEPDRAALARQEIQNLLMSYGLIHYPNPKF